MAKPANKQDIIAYLDENRPPNLTVERIDEKTDLIGSGIIDSFGIVGFITFLEETYGITVPDVDIDPDNFRTVERIVEYVSLPARGGR